MTNTERLEDFYKRKFKEVPDDVIKKEGHFNLFRLEPIPKGTTRPVPYQRRDYYKVMLCKGGVHFHYADKLVAIKKQALVFSYSCPESGSP